MNAWAEGGWLKVVLDHAFQGVTSPSEERELESFTGLVRDELRTLNQRTRLPIGSTTPMAAGLLSMTLRRVFGVGTTVDEIVRGVHASDANFLVTALARIPRGFGTVDDRASAMLLLCSKVDHSGYWPINQIIAAHLAEPDVIGWEGMATLVAYSEPASLGAVLRPILLRADAAVRAQFAFSLAIMATEVGKGLRRDLISPQDLRRTLDDDIRQNPRGIGIPVPHYYHGPKALPPIIANLVKSAAPGFESRQSTSAPRFLQQRSFVERDGQMHKATHGFIAGQPASVRVRIGLPNAAWNALLTAFPVEALPQTEEAWPLRVWLTAAEHLDEPLVRNLKLPREGNSDEAEFSFVPRGASSSFEGRLTVLHDGRVIQTAVLRAAVQPNASLWALGNPPRLEDFIPVRQSLGDLQTRRQFDLAFVLNDTATGKPQAVGLSANHAWLSDLSQAKSIAEDISLRLAPIARSAADYAEGLTGKKGLELLIQLAQAGSLLNEFLVNQQINAHGNRPEIARTEYLQVVSTKLDAVIPFEFIFDHAAPEDDAQLCPKWRDGIAKGKCANACDRTTGKHVCPMGFWGLQKVIERHALSPELATTGRELFLQSEVSTRRPALQLGGVCVFGASDRVKEHTLTRFAKVIKDSAGEEADKVSDWDAWMKAVARRRPKLLIAFAHTDGKGFNATLEIGGKALKSVLLRETHLRANAQDPPPLVALLGCDTVGTADEYSNHAAMFRSKGAAIVIATIATVLGDHAAQVAQSLVTGLLAGNGEQPLCVGELLRAIKRQALLDHQMMALCLVAYGDADWQIKLH